MMFTYCPRDNFGLSAKNLDGVDVFQCTQCHGVWIPKESLVAFNKTQQISMLEDYLEGGQLPEHFKLGALLCPTDGKAMLFTTLNDVEIDICHTCHGIWLDKGEMESLSATKSTSTSQSDHSLGYHAMDALVHIPTIVDADTLQAGAEFTGETASAVLEGGAEVVSGAGELLGNLLAALFEGLSSG